MIGSTKSTRILALLSTFAVITGTIGVSSYASSQGNPRANSQTPQRPNLQTQQFQKAGDTILPFRRKWGYDSAAATPKARLFWITDSAIVGSDWSTLPVPGASTATFTQGTSGASPLPLGDARHKEAPTFGRLINSAVGAPIAIHMASEVFTPDGQVVDLEAQVDLAMIDAPITLALVVHQNGTVFAGPSTTVTAKGWQRVSLKTLIGSPMTKVAGVGTNPFAGDQPYTFGLLARPVNPASRATMGLDNFEIRIAMKCSPTEQAARIAASKARAAEQRKALQTKIQAITFTGDYVATPAEVAKQKADYEAGNKQPPINNSQLKVVNCCHDDEPKFNSSGEMDLSGEGIPADAEIEATANFIEEERPLTDVYQGADTRTTDWLGQLPCSPSVGDFVPDEINDLDLRPGQDIEDEIGEDTQIDEVYKKDDLSDWKDDPQKFPNLVTSNLGPVPQWILNGGISMEPPLRTPGKPMTLGGRDIVFVHGLKLQHIYDGLLKNRSFANAQWKSIPGATSQMLYAANPTFFPNRNLALLHAGKEQAATYHGDLAFKNWVGDNSIPRTNPLLNVIHGNPQHISSITTMPGFVGVPNFPIDGHIGTFLLGNGYHNRFMIASYNCMDRLDGAVRSVLSQVAMAMADGIGVYNPAATGGLSPTWDLSDSSDAAKLSDGRARAFGSTGLVFITQSTGALVVDVAMSRAKGTPGWNVRYIPDFTRAHIAAQGAFGGSHVASLAYQLRDAPLQVMNAAAPKFFGGTDPFDPSGKKRDELAGNLSHNDLNRYQSQVTSTIIQDLRPQIVYSRHRGDIASTPVQTLAINGGHPSSVPIAKHILHPGFDDNTVNTNATVASAGHWQYWPFGVATGSVRKNFDLGLLGPALVINPNRIPKIRLGPLLQVTAKIGTTYAAQERRALGYWVDQRIDPRFLSPALRSNQSLQSIFLASGASPYLSMSGMVQTNVAPIPGPMDPNWRLKNHFGFLSAAGDHFEPTHDQGLSDMVQAPLVPGMESDIHYPHYQESKNMLKFVSDLADKMRGANVNPLVKVNWGGSFENNDEESFVSNSTMPFQSTEAPGVLSIYQKLQGLGMVGNPQAGKWNGVQSLLKTSAYPQVHLRRGCYIEVKWKSKLLKKQGSKTWWWWYRDYVLLKDWRSMGQFDYVYGKNGVGGVLR